MSKENNNGQRWNRESAKRVFAGEYKLVDEFYKESDDDKAPNYALLPSGEKANRVLVMGTLTDKDEVSDNFWSMRVFDGTDSFIVSAGQYQPNALRQLKNIDTPEYVSVVAKTSNFEGEDGSLISTLTAENMTVVDETMRNTWVKETARQTLDRLEKEPNPVKSKARDLYQEEDLEEVRKSVVEALESLN